MITKTFSSTEQLFLVTNKVFYRQVTGSLYRAHTYRVKPFRTPKTYVKGKWSYQIIPETNKVTSRWLNLKWSDKHLMAMFYMMCVQTSQVKVVPTFDIDEVIVLESLYKDYKLVFTNINDSYVWSECKQKSEIYEQ